MPSATLVARSTTVFKTARELSPTRSVTLSPAAFTDQPPYILAAGWPWAPSGALPRSTHYELSDLGLGASTRPPRDDSGRRATLAPSLWQWVAVCSGNELLPCWCPLVPDAPTSPMALEVVTEIDLVYHD